MTAMRATGAIPWKQPNPRKEKTKFDEIYFSDSLIFFGPNPWYNVIYSVSFRCQWVGGWCGFCTGFFGRETDLKFTMKFRETLSIFLNFHFLRNFPGIMWTRLEWMLRHHTKKSLGACGAKSALVSGFGVGKKLKFALTNFFRENPPWWGSLLQPGNFWFLWNWKFLRSLAGRGKKSGTSWSREVNPHEKS